MARSREEIRLEIQDLFDLDSWGDKEKNEFEALIKEYPEESEEDTRYIEWTHEGAFLFYRNPPPTE